MNSSNKKVADVDAYIKDFPESTQKILQKIRQIVKEEAPEATEVIGYGMPTYKMPKNLVHFAAFKNHIGFYPTPTGVAAFEKEISKYKNAKGSVQFPLNDPEKPIPYDLIRKIVKFRVEEVENGN